MKLKMAKNSLFAILLRSPWWISLSLGGGLGLVGMALLPADLRVAGALSGFPFLVIGVMAARRQWQLPGAAEVAHVRQATAAMAWPAFAQLLEAAFVRGGYTVTRGAAEPVDFRLERQGRTTLVCARRWKSARTGLEALRALQAAREAAGADEAIYVSLGELSDTARPFATRSALTLWQDAELARALHGLPLPQAPAR